MSFATPVESTTISELAITVTLELKDYNNHLELEVVKSYPGKSTRPMTLIKKYPNNLIFRKNEMEKEAKNAALMDFFRDDLGFTVSKDLFFDELHRPLKEIKLRSGMMKN